MEIDLTGVVLAIIAAIGAFALFFRKKPQQAEEPQPEPTPPPTCEPPILYGAFVGGCEPYEWGNGVFLDMGHQVHGCDSKTGLIEGVYGAKSPAGRPLTYEWHAQREGAEEEDPVYNHEGRKINGQKIADRLVRWYVGGPPPHPVRFNPLGCGCDPTPSPPSPPLADGHALLLCLVRDDCGNEVKWQRRVGIQAKQCG